LSVTFASGYIAGIACAIISHPLDTIVSKLYHQTHDEHKGAIDAIKNISRELGFKGLWRGLGPRIFMIGTLTGF